MATRYSGDGTIRMSFVDRDNNYRCSVNDGHGGQGTVYVGLAGKIDKPVDSPEAYDEVAHAAISFADHDGLVDSSYFETTDSGWAVSRKPRSKSPRRSSIRIGAPGSVARHVQEEFERDLNAYGKNKFAVFEYVNNRPVLRAAQTTKDGALRYMEEGRVLIDLDSYRR